MSVTWLTFKQLSSQTVRVVLSIGRDGKINKYFTIITYLTFSNNDPDIFDRLCCDNNINMNILLINYFNELAVM